MKKGHKTNPLNTSLLKTDPIAEKSLESLTDVFPANWQTLSDNALATTIRNLLVVISNRSEFINKRRKALHVLDNLAWHSKTRRRILNSDIDALPVLCDLCFNNEKTPATSDPNSEKLDQELQFSLRLLGLDTLNKICLSNGLEIIECGVFTKIIDLGKILITPQLATSEGYTDTQVQQLLLCIVNILLTFSNNKECLPHLVYGHNSKDKTKNSETSSDLTALEIILNALNNGPKVVKGSAAITLRKLCETCPDKSDLSEQIKKRIIETNSIKLLIQLLYTSEELTSTLSPESSMVMHKHIVLDILFSIAHLDNFESESSTGDLCLQIIKFGGVIITTKIIKDLIQTITEDQLVHSVENLAISELAKVDTLKSAIRLLSNMAFVEQTHNALLSANVFECFISGILYSRYDHETISFASRAVYVLFKKYSEKVNGNSTSVVKEDVRKNYENMKDLIKKYFEPLAKYLMKVIKLAQPQQVSYPSNAAFMLRHLCLLLFLFSGDVELVEKILDIESEGGDILTSLELMLHKTVPGIQINALAVLANIVEIQKGAEKVGKHTKLILELNKLANWKGSDTGKAALKDNASYAINALKKKIPDVLKDLGIEVLPEEPKRSCGFCSKDETTLGEFPVCARCKSTYYCCPLHQKNHWPEHKKICVAPNQK